MFQSYNNTHHMKTKHRDKDRTRDYAKRYGYFYVLLDYIWNWMLLRTILTYGMETSLSIALLYLFWQHYLFNVRVSMVWLFHIYAIIVDLLSPYYFYHLYAEFRTRGFYKNVLLAIGAF